MNHDKQKFFFEQYGLNEADLERYLGAALGAGGDYADLYFEYLTTTSITLDESMVKSASQGISAGCGVRVISGERTGYAYTDDLAPEKILRAARTAALIASGPAKQPVVNLKEHDQRNLYPVNTFSVDADISAKLALVQRADAAARAHDARIAQGEIAQRRPCEHVGLRQRKIVAHVDDCRPTAAIAMTMRAVDMQI